MTHAGRPLLHIAAAVIVRDGRVLVQTRPAGTHYAGFWEFPGGKREANEEPAACAVRECAEELGLAVEAAEVFEVVEWDYEVRLVQVTFVRCRVVGDAEPEPQDGQRVRWADVDDLERLTFLPANASVLRRLAAELRAPT